MRYPQKSGPQKSGPQKSGPQKSGLKSRVLKSPILKSRTTKREIKNMGERENQEIRSINGIDENGTNTKL